MQVSVETILNKIEQEVTLAKKEHHTQKVREHAAAIRTLCDLILDEPEGTEGMTSISPIQRVYEEEDDANGNSLLDF